MDSNIKTIQISSTEIMESPVKTMGSNIEKNIALAHFKYLESPVKEAHSRKPNPTYRADPNRQHDSPDPLGFKTCSVWFRRVQFFMTRPEPDQKPTRTDLCSPLVVYANRIQFSFRLRKCDKPIPFFMLLNIFKFQHQGPLSASISHNEPHRQHPSNQQSGDDKVSTETTLGMLTIALTLKSRSKLSSYLGLLYS